MNLVPGAARARLNRFSLSRGMMLKFVHQHDHAEITSTSHDRQHAWIRGVELLRVRVQLEYFETKRGNAGNLFDRGFAIIWMDRRNGKHLRVLLCKGEMGVVAFSDFVGMPDQSPGLARRTTCHQNLPDQFLLFSPPSRTDGVTSRLPKDGHDYRRPAEQVISSPVAKPGQ